ncbi:alpha-L-fucosidase [Planctomycetota bacterium]
MKCDCSKERWGLLFKPGLAVMVIVIMLLSTTSMGAEEGPVVRVEPTAMTRLYGRPATKAGAAASLDQLPENMVIRWVGRGSISWQVDVRHSGDYEVALCYAALTSGAKLKIISRGGQSKITSTVHKTTGPFEDRQISEEGPLHTDFLRNYERVPLDGVLHLPAGISKLTLRVTEPESGEVMDLWAMELIPVAAKQSIAEAEERARRSQASTDWFVEAKYGVMFHFDPHSQPRHGPKKPYPEAIRDFDVNAFADMVEETGAGYVIFTLNHGHHNPDLNLWFAPIKSWEKLHSGSTTKRDLIGEIADALGKRGIKLIIYIASSSLLEDALSSDSISGGDDAFDAHVEILKEMGLRYGRKLAGYWFDSWDRIPQMFTNAPASFERLFKATKTGNPDRIIALNFWIFPDATLWQEYWAAEADEELKPAKGRYIGYDAGRGLQRHALFMLEGIWVHSRPNSEMEEPVFTEEELISYVKQLTANKGVATVNLGIYQDGTIGEKSRKLMRALRRAFGK